LTFTVPPFRHVDSAAGEFIAFQTQANHVGASGDLDAGRRELAGGDAVDKDFRAGGGGVYLGPSDTAGSGFELEVNGGLDIVLVLNLNLADIRFVAFEAEDEVVGACGKGKSDGGRAGLLVAVDEDIGAVGRVPTKRPWRSLREGAFDLENRRSSVRVRSGPEDSPLFGLAGCSGPARDR